MDFSLSLDASPLTVACSSFVASVVHITNIPLSRTTVSEAFVGGSMTLQGSTSYWESQGDRGRDNKTTQFCFICYSPSNSGHVLPLAVDSTPKRENPRHRALSVDAASVDTPLARATPMAKPS